MESPVIIGNATLYCGDCLEILPAIRKQVDAIVSDPPYGIGYQHGGGNNFAASTWGGRAIESLQKTVVVNTKPIHGDNAPFDPAPWLDFEKVVLFGANHYAQRLPDRGSWLCWDKSLGQGPHDSFVDAEFAWCSARVRRNVFRHLWKGVMGSGEDSLNAGKRRYHPSMKPRELMRWCIEHLHLRPNATVLDPYMGSGSTGIAAITMGHRFIGIEIAPDYFAIACARIEKAGRMTSPKGAVYG